MSKSEVYPSELRANASVCHELTLETEVPRTKAIVSASAWKNVVANIHGWWNEWAIESKLGVDPQRWILGACSSLDILHEARGGGRGKRMCATGSDEKWFRGPKNLSHVIRTWSCYQSTTRSK